MAGSQPTSKRLLVESQIGVDVAGLVGGKVPVAQIPDRIVSVEEYAALAGALGQNWGPAIQAAIDAVAAKGGGHVLLRARSYVTTQEIKVTTSNVIIAGQGAASEIVQSGAMTSIVSFKGTLPAKAAPTTTLTADAGWSNQSTLTGATITVASAAGLAVGDILVVGDDATIPWQGGAWGSRYAGELQRIKSIAGNVVTLYGRLRGTYAVARAASIHKLTPLKNVGLRDLSIRNSAPGTTTAMMANFYSCADVIVDNVSFSGGDGPAVELDYIFGADISMTARDLSDNSGAGRYGYGVNMGPSEAVKIHDSTFQRLRHGITTNGYDGHRGYANNFLASNCIATETTGASFDTHPGSSGTFAHCIASQSSDTCFSIRSQVDLIDCEASYANLGFYVQGAASRDVQIISPIIHHIEGFGITFYGDATSGYPVNTMIVDPVIRDTKSAGIGLGGPLAGLQIIRPVISRAGDAGANQAAAITVGDDSGMTDVAIVDALVSGANSVVNIGANATGVTVTGARLRNGFGLTAAVIKGVGMATANLFDNADLDKPGDFTVPDLASNSYFYTTSPTSSSTAGLTVGSLRVVPWLVRRTVRISELLADVVTAGEAGSQFRVGLYKDDGTGKPGALVVDSGAVAASAAGVFGASFSGVTLKPGLYWIGAVTQNAPTTQPIMRTIGSGWTPAVPVSAGSSQPTTAGVAMGWQAGGVTGALPATFPAPGLTTFAARALARVA